MRYARPLLAAALAGALVLTACAPRAVRGPGVAEAKPAPARPSDQAAAGPAAGAARLQPPADQPVQILSDHLSYTNQGQVTVFTGHVRVIQERAKLEAPYLEVRSADQLAFARQGIRLVDHERGITVTARELDYQKNLANTTARGNVRLVSHDDQGVPFQLSSKQLSWNVDQKQARALGQVVVTYRGSTATAQAMTYQQADQVVELWADAGAKVQPRLQGDGDTITGDKLRLNLRTRNYEAEGSARAELLLRERPGTPDKEKP